MCEGGQGKAAGTRGAAGTQWQKHMRTLHHSELGTLPGHAPCLLPTAHTRRQEFSPRGAEEDTFSARGDNSPGILPSQALVGQYQHVFPVSQGRCRRRKSVPPQPWGDHTQPLLLLFLRLPSATLPRTSLSSPEIKSCLLPLGSLPLLNIQEAVSTGCTFCGSLSTGQEHEWPMTVASPSPLERRLLRQQESDGSRPGLASRSVRTSRHGLPCSVQQVLKQCHFIQRHLIVTLMRYCRNLFICSSLC